jgi:hypothetical protein
VTAPQAAEKRFTDVILSEAKNLALRSFMNMRATPYDFPCPDVLSIPNPARSGSSWKGDCYKSGQNAIAREFPRFWR